MTQQIGEVIKEGAVLGSLTSTSLLGVLVIVLSGIAWHLYKTINSENKQVLDDLLKEQQRSNTLMNEQTKVYKVASEGIVKFIEVHCANTNAKLDRVEDALKQIDNKLIVIGKNDA